MGIFKRRQVSTIDQQEPDKVKRQNKICWKRDLFNSDDKRLVRRLEISSGELVINLLPGWSVSKLETGCSKRWFRSGETLILRTSGQRTFGPLDL
jgi:hypothetical protein